MTDFMHSLLFRDKDLNLLCKNGLGSLEEGFDANSDAALQQANADLVTKINTLESNANVANRTETYFTENQALVLYINKMLIFMYVVIYLIMGFALYTQYEKMSAVKIGFILTIFAILPFTIDLISKFLYKRFLEILHFFYTGNSLYLYEPKKMTDTL